MKKLALLLALGAAMLLVSLATAAAPTRQTIPFAGSENYPAGTACDFNYRAVYSGTDELTFYSDGRLVVHETLSVAHTNDDTHVTLTEKDRINTTFDAAGGAKSVGVFWHLRDANGKIVVVQAGQIVYDPIGNVVKFTPNINPDFVAVLCPALGGHPAP